MPDEVSPGVWRGSWDELDALDAADAEWLGPNGSVPWIGSEAERNQFRGEAGRARLARLAEHLRGGAIAELLRERTKMIARGRAAAAYNLIATPRASRFRRQRR